MANVRFIRNIRSFSWASVLLGVLVFAATAPTFAQSTDAIDRLIQQLDQPSASKRLDAVRKLAQLGLQASKASDALIARLDDTNDDVRVQAAYAVSCVRIDDIRALEALVLSLLDSDEHVRYSAEWSIARIAKELPNNPTSEAKARLAPILQEALKSLQANDHQPRNRIAVELALHRLAESQSATTKPVIQAEPPTPPAIESISLAKSVYEASDQLGRFLFVNKLSDSNKYPDSLRQIVLTIESSDPDGVVFDYALGKWGESGQKSLAVLIDQLDTYPTVQQARLIQNQIPDSPSQLERLLSWATDRNQEQWVRIASIMAIGRTKIDKDRCIDSLIGIVSDEKSDEQTRADAVDALAKFGSEASRAEPCLLAALQQTELTSLRFSALDATKLVAPNSAMTTRTLVSILNNEPTDSFIYWNVVEACGELEGFGKEAIWQLIVLLHQQDSDLRGAAAKALGSIGTTEPSAIEALVNRIVDLNEIVGVKNRASVALGKMGLPAIELLMGALKTREPEFQDSILRALAIIGPNAISARPLCLAILFDEQKSDPLRAAAANAVGAMGPSELSIAKQVLDYCDVAESELIRGACLIAAAQMHPEYSKLTIAKHTREPSILIRASAAYALHRCGESKAGFDLLVSMLNGSETDSVICQTLGDFGSIIEPWCVEVAKDTQATREARLECFSIACKATVPQWNELLPLVEDFELGEDFTTTLEGYWHPLVADNHPESIASIGTLLSILENQSFTTVARTRIAGLLAPEGLGAGEDEEDWQGITLSKPIATSSLLAADATTPDDMTAAAKPSRSTSSESWPGSDSGSTMPGSPSPPIAAEPATEIVPSVVPSGEAIRPKVSIRARAADQNKLQPKLPRVVDVFYGTNRVRLSVSTALDNFQVPMLATIAGSFAIMLFSLIGLWRSGSRAFATISLLAIGFIAPMSLLAIQKISTQFSYTPIAFGGNHREEIEYGRCQVSIPPDHQPGELEAPSLLRLEVKSDPNKHVVLTRIEQLSHDDFHTDLQLMQAKNGKNLLVFVHGYNVSFEDAARRTAQMSDDLKFPGAPVFFSWPSQANWYGYRTDHENIQLSIAQIKTFLLDLVERSGAETINLVAHSMGNVGLTEALKEIHVMDEKPLFNQVVLAAPDIDANIFKSRIAPHIVGKAKNLTLYTSQSDLALIASRFFNSGQRIGDSGPEALQFPGIDTIDATAVDSSLLGHSYYGDSVSVLTDLGQLLRNQPISNRHYLKQVNDGVARYWAFDPLRISQKVEASVR